MAYSQTVEPLLTFDIDSTEYSTIHNVKPVDMATECKAERACIEGELMPGTPWLPVLVRTLKAT